ncbi:reverse transcriptase [Plakobranchus ocellatus]|uniref:Reverse transcriptase n=1 Tax=Plakobranchus ocellatus TaxID=259542 RepID=A0AAV4BZX6_9GAST|nr:reverse transcriptase [Plakobranchus ocellatus]
MVYATSEDFNAQHYNPVLQRKQNAKNGSSVRCSNELTQHELQAEEVSKPVHKESSEIHSAPSKTGRKWKVDEAVNKAKEGLKMKEVIGLVQTGRKGLGIRGNKVAAKNRRKRQREKCKDLSKKLQKAGYKYQKFPLEVGTRGFLGTSAYNLLNKHSSNGQRRTKALKALAKTA